MLFLIIGNCISVVAAVFTALSSWVKDVHKTYIFQTWQCVLLAVSSIFFGSYAGISTLLLCALRNILVAKGKFTGKLCILFLLLVAALGWLTNNRGIVGWIAIVATLIYTVGSYLLKNTVAIKGNILVNLLFWIAYEILIHDFPSLLMDTIAAVITVIALIRYSGMKEAA